MIDPCYNKDSLMMRKQRKGFGEDDTNHLLSIRLPVRNPSTWRIHEVNEEEKKEEKYDDDKNSTQRVFSTIVFADEAVDLPGLWENKDGGWNRLLGFQSPVDSGTLGLFDLGKHPKDIGSYEDKKTFYGHICQLLRDSEYAPCISKDYGLVASMGGDGRFDVDIATNKNGHVLAVRIRPWN